jgi:hypothetical protein
MKLYNLNDYTRGWVAGNFDPVIFKSTEYEVGVKYYKLGDKEEKHYHKFSDELTIIVKGLVKMNDNFYIQGDIILIEKEEITDFESLTDTITVVIRNKSVMGDKYVLHKS